MLGSIFLNVVDTYVISEPHTDSYLVHVLLLLDILWKCGLIYGLMQLAIALRIYIRKNRES